MIYGSRLRQVRELRGLTQTELARRLNVNQSAIARIERDEFQPTADLLEKIALQTVFPPAFFRQRSESDFPLGTLLFRSRTAMTSRERARAHRYAQTLFHVVEQLSRDVKEIPLRLPTIDEEPITAARVTRASLAISPDTPIGNLINVLERSGVIVLALPIDLKKGDAFSLWTGVNAQRPIIAVSRTAFGDRLRWSVAHEAGHLVMHRTPRGNIASVEREADQFAAELLTPTVAMEQEITIPVTITSISRLKPRWGVSIQALIRRARDLDMISQRQYRYLFEQLSARGWRMREPSNLDIPIEKPRALRKMVELLYGNPVDYENLSSEVHLTKNFLRESIEDHAEEPAKQADIDESVARATTISPFSRTAWRTGHGDR